MKANLFESCGTKGLELHRVELRPQLGWKFQNDELTFLNVDQGSVTVRWKRKNKKMSADQFAVLFPSSTPFEIVAPSSASIKAVTIAAGKLASALYANTEMKEKYILLEEFGNLDDSFADLCNEIQSTGSEDILDYVLVDFLEELSTCLREKYGKNWGPLLEALFSRWSEQHCEGANDEASRSNVDTSNVVFMPNAN